MNAKPNGVVPADGCDRTARIDPSRSSVIVSIVFEPVLVTASAVPAGFSDTWAGAESADVNAVVPPSIRPRPARVAQKPATFGVPAFSTYTRPWPAVRLLGPAPPDDTTAMRRRCVP